MVSVITVCLNSEKCIEDTIRSVLAQRDADIEYIIKDGGSTDRTNEIVEDILADITNERINVRHLTEKDSGIYDAMNRASDLASGDQIIFLNAGDRFFDENVIRDAALYFDEKADVYFGNTVYTMKLCFFPQLHYADRERMRISVGHQSCFYSRRVLREYRFDTSYRISGDHEQLLRLFNDGKAFVHMNLFVAVCDREGVSNNRSDLHFEELYRIGHGGKLIKDGRYFAGLFAFRLRSLLAKAMPVTENRRYCLNNLRRTQFAVPKNLSSSIIQRQ